MRRAVAVMVLGVVLLASTPGRAAFHIAVIDEFMSGCGADPTVQFVEIRMLSSGQNFVSGTKLVATSCDGSVVETLLTVPSNISNGMSGARWIMGSSSFQAAAGIAPDFVMTDSDPGIFPDCGKICWGATGQTVDCVAYGPYTGPPPAANSPVANTPNSGSQSLTRAGGGAFNNNFALALPSPMNSMGEVGNLGACTGGGATTSTTTGGGVTSTTIGPPLRGGGPAKTDCFAEWRVAVVGDPGTAPVVRCTDNDPACDQNPATGCRIRLQLCFNDAAQAIYGGRCAVGPVTAFALADNTDAQTAATVGAALQQLQGAQPSVGGVSFDPPLGVLACTGPIELDVPLRVKGTKTKKGVRALKSLTTADKRDRDKLKILCIP